MPRFLPEYRVLDTRSQSERIILVVSLTILFLLMPATVLGYYSENSLPGQPLYPVKRGIESMVLAIESVSPYSKSLYYQALAQNRVTETSTLIAQATVTGNFTQLAQSDSSLNDAVTSIQQAAVSIKTISNPVEKKKAQDQLTVSIQKYQTQLSQMTYTIQKNVITYPTPTPTSPPPSILNTQQTPTPTPDPAATLQNQINQTQTDLQTISNTIQQPAPPPMPTATPTPSPTTVTPTTNSGSPTPTPTPTFAPSPTPTPTNTPWWWGQQWNHQGGGQQGQGHGQGGGD